VAISHEGRFTCDRKLDLPTKTATVVCFFSVHVESSLYGGLYASSKAQELLVVNYENCSVDTNLSGDQYERLRTALPNSQTLRGTGRTLDTATNTRTYEPLLFVTGSSLCLLLARSGH